MEKGKPSWFSLIFVWVAAAVTIALTLGALFAVFAFASATPESVSPSAMGKQGDSGRRAFGGMVTDSQCGARHPRNSNMSPAECTRFCVRHGATYVLVDGERIYELQGNLAQINQFAGQRTTVEGTLNGSTIIVVSISAGV